MDLIITDQNFSDVVLKSATPVLVDFYADWCGPCKMMAPIVEEIAKEYEGKLIVGKLDVDANQQTAIKYNVMGIPTLLIFKGGQPIKQMVGYQDKGTIQTQINSALAS